MPKDFFQLFPTIQYDVDGDGAEKVAVDILRRVKLNADSLLDGAVFYNYQMQDGDTAEIIADKYYGSARYHWVVLLMNNIVDHTYDLALNDVNFENYLKDLYGSMERSSGVTKSLSDVVAAGGTANVVAEWRVSEITASDSASLRSGTIPAGNSTGFYIRGEIGENPWGTNIGVGDTINLFVPESWYLAANTDTSPTTYPDEYARIPYTFPATIVATSERVDSAASLTHSFFYLTTDMNSNTYAAFTWDDGTDDVYITTGIHHFERDIYANDGTTLLANNVIISQDQYVNTSIGVAGTKRIVTNYDFENEANDNRRNIYLLRKEYLNEFVDEFEALINIGAS